jgi:hypothetical protein
MLGLIGAGISGGNPAQGTFFAADRISNFEPASNYAYHGGTVTPPGGIYLGGAGGTGLFDYGLAMQYAPDPPGSPAIFIGCPLSGCGDGGFFYNLFSLMANGGSTSFSFTPATNVLALSGKGLNLKNEPLIAPSLQGEMRGAAANLEFAPIDSAGHKHSWILSAPPVGDGVSLTLPSASGTLALNSAFGGSGLNHSAGLVPDPGPRPGAARFLREDGKWASMDGCEDLSLTPTVHSAVLRLPSTPADSSTMLPRQFPAVVAHASRISKNTPLLDLIDYTPATDGTFRLTVSVFVESRCDSGTFSVNASLSPIAGHSVGKTETLDCTESDGSTTATITAHSSAGAEIHPRVKFNGVSPGGLRYMVDVILEQLQ